jgi:hypothetical protein
VKADSSKAQLIIATEGDPQGTTPDAGQYPALSTQAIALQLTGRIPTQLNGRDLFPEFLGPFYASPQSSIAAVGFYRKFQTETQFAVERIDLASGKSLDVHLFDAGMRLGDISPSGKLIAFDNNNYSAVRKTVQVFNVESADAKRLVAFQPYTDGGGATWCRFVDDAHLLTMNFKHELTLWKIPEAQVVYRVATDSVHSEPILSPNRKQLLVTINKQFVLLDASSGKTIGRFEKQLVPWGKPRFTPDGSRVIVGALTHVLAGDVMTGKLLYDASVPSPAQASAVSPVGDGMLMLGSAYLFDPQKQFVPWQYSANVVGTSLDAGQTFGDRYYLLMKLGSGDDVALVSLKLPQPAVAAKLAGTDLAKMMTITPGMTVSLEVNVSAPGDPAKIREYLTKAIEKAGLKLADNQAIKLVATNTPGKTAEVTFREGFQDVGKRMLTDQTLRLAFERDGEVLWETVSKYNATDGRPTLIIKPGQSLDQALAEEQAKSFDFFTRVAIPGYVQRKSPNGQIGLGRSTITASGIKDE